MASLYNKDIKEGLAHISNSNKNIFIKKDEKKEKRKNVLITNSSIKKMKQIKKISINDNENKSLITKSTKKLDSSNKENHVINNKEKIDLKKYSQKKALKNIVNAAKIQIKQNLPKKIDKNIKCQNKLSTLINNSDKKSQVNNNHIQNEDEDEAKIKEIMKNKEKEKDISQMNISNNKSSIIKNEKKEDLDETINSKEPESALKYDRKNMSEKKIAIKTGGSSGNILVKMKKEHIKYSIKKKKQKPNINIKSKKLIYEEEFLNNIYIKKYNSINNEKENNRSFIDIINNFDIINIINKKEETKKLSSSIQKDRLNNTHEFSKKKTKKLNNSKIKNSEKSAKSNKKIITKKEDEKSYVPITMRNINISNNSLSLLKIEKRMNSISCLIEKKNITQNKWDNKYFIPIVSASLINGEEKKKEREKYYKKINTNKNNLNRNNYITNSKKSINFGDNNKKKREMLFNFSNKKIKSEDYSYISFQSKRTNSFIDKRNKHITERNNSINTLKKNKLNLENDLKQQEQKLEIIKNKISQEKIKEKMNEHNICAISVDNIYDNSFDKNKMEEIINHQYNKKNNKKYKTFHIKVNSMNIIQKGEKKRVIIKRGDLLNRLRKIKHNYFVMENEK